MLDLNRFLAFIKQEALFLPEERILLAVSGGRDSVLMAHFFKQAGFQFGIAHCNFNLRNEESDADEQFTSELAQSFEVPFFSTGFDTKAYAEERHISIQMAARDLRYQWLEEIRNDFDFQYIALAHHQNDTIETILLNLTRGTGIAGLHGILPKRDKLIRPLLFLNRDEIDELVKSQQISYRDDSSNQSTKYARNKIRLEVIPRLKELNPDLEETFAANIRRFTDLEQLLNIRLKELKDALFIESNPQEFKIKLSGLKKLNPLNTLLYGMFQPYGFTEAVLQDLVKSWDGQAGKTFISPSHQLILDRKWLILASKKQEEIAPVLVNPEEETIRWNKQEFKSQILQSEDFYIRNNRYLAQLDFGLLQFPLTLRSWRRGDYFCPLGMKGKKKKLSDYFIEQKIALNHKSNIAILENGNGDIVWIAGYRPDERYKITASSKKIFTLEQLAAHGK